MFTLDSDLLGLLIALLTFFVPVLTSIMEKRKKKRKEGISALQRSREESLQEQDNMDFLPDESFHSMHEPAPQMEEDEPMHPAASELEELFNDILGINVQQHNVPDGEDHSVADVVEMEEKGSEMDNDEAVGKIGHEEKILEGEAATLHLDEQVPPVGEEILKEVPQEDKGLKKRIKENPKDMVLFAEILKPKFKEY